MGKAQLYSSERRERAVRMVQEHPSEYPSRWAASRSIAALVGSGARLPFLRQDARRGVRRGNGAPRHGGEAVGKLKHPQALRHRSMAELFIGSAELPVEGEMDRIAKLVGGSQSGEGRNGAWSR